MTEKEKMERGEWHDANFDEELLANGRGQRRSAMTSILENPEATRSLTP